MHSVPNIDGEETYAICNCCGCGCYAIRNAAYYNAPDMVRSNYVAETDSTKCVACGQCVENCPVNALKLGQKLCGSPGGGEAGDHLPPGPYLAGEALECQLP